MPERQNRRRRDKKALPLTENELQFESEGNRVSRPLTPSEDPLVIASTRVRLLSEQVLADIQQMVRNNRRADSLGDADSVDVEWRSLDPEPKALSAPKDSEPEQ